MSSTNANLRVLGIAGSLRRGSFNRALIRAALDLAPDSMTIEMFDLGPLPLFNADLEEQGDPLSVAEFKQAIRDAGALLIATPEYNYGMPGVLKNALDWASRPPESPLNNKPVAIMGASPGRTGTGRSQLQLRQTLQSTRSPTMPGPEVLVAQAHELVNEDGVLTDDKTRRYIVKLLEALAEWVPRF
ncbi:MAG: NAD(P)H-dependent oxidoreductase [Gemmatimonadetes bacterium]|nr:NAD(P)H-dependent oxidoreductase [Gemmatimonadota bacterium]